MVFIHPQDTPEVAIIVNKPPLPQDFEGNKTARYRPTRNCSNQSISENNFPSSLKKASILPFFKKSERSDKKNYRPVSVLSSLSKIFGKIFQKQIIEYIDNKLSMYISAYRKGHSTQHVLMRMIEDWKKR